MPFHHTHPLRNKTKSTRAFRNNKSSLIYGKGTAYFRQLEKLVGSEKLQKGLRIFVQKYKGDKNHEMNGLLECFDTEIMEWSKMFIEETKGINVLEVKE